MDLCFEEIKVRQNQSITTIIMCAITKLNQCGINSEICSLDSSDTLEWEEIIEAKAGSLQY